jgi:hypothetical protein
MNALAMNALATNSLAMNTLTARWAIGLLRLPGGFQPYPVSLRDIERDSSWARSVFERVGIRSGLPMHLIGAGCDNEILWPYENALIGMRVPFGVAEPVAIDAPRSDMFLRRFKMQAVMGLSGELVDALIAMGRDLKALLGHSTVVAQPDAVAALRASALAPWVMHAIGPIWAFESPDCDGARYDESEWLVEEDAGELLLTAVAPRACPLVRLRTGVHGTVVMHGGERRVHA